ncbi:MAG: autotransporter-associated beta strand repeat-containing protein, partial [Thermoguttaceae bacterium]|nr:autotransporter-associated beta strand repeat-containing protein [Thermoguttaceae bacterium]
MFVSMTKFPKTLCLAILVLACAAIVPAMAQTVTYTNGEIYNAPNINTDSYDTVYFVITDASLHSYPRNLSGGGYVDYTGKSVNYYLKLTGDNSAFSGTLNVHNSDANTGMYFASTNAGFSQGTLILGDKCYVRTAMSTDATIPIGALEGTGFLRNDESAGHTITYQLGGANKDATFSGQIMNTYRSNVSDYPVAIKKVGTGTQTFAGNNTYTGATTISEGTIRLIGDGTLGSATSDITVTSSAASKWATLELAQESGEINFTRNVKSNYYSNAATGGNQTGRLIKSGAATLNFSGNISSTGFETTAGVT